MPDSIQIRSEAGTKNEKLYRVPSPRLAPQTRATPWRSIAVLAAAVAEHVAVAAGAAATPGGFPHAETITTSAVVLLLPPLLLLLLPPLLLVRSGWTPQALQA